VGKGNNGMLIKDLLKKRWWWNISEEKGKRFNSFIWTQLKEKSYYLNKEKRCFSEHVKLRSDSMNKTKDNLK
jgi:hypothetical protein